MPYKQIWVEPDKDPKLRSWEELPDGYEESKFSFGYKSARQRTDTLLSSEMPYSLHLCKGEYGGMFDDDKGCGWVEGSPNSYKVNTLAPLSGKRGTDYHCAKCGASIGFFGCVS